MKQTVIKSEKQKHSLVSRSSLSRLLVCTLSAGFIQHPCPALFTSYFLYYPLSTFWRQSAWALQPRLSSSDYHFCVIRRLCLTQIKVIHPLFKWYVPTAGPGYHVLSADTLILFPGNKWKNKLSHKAWPDKSYSDILIAWDPDEDQHSDYNLNYHKSWAIIDKNVGSSSTSHHPPPSPFIF